MTTSGELSVVLDGMHFLECPRWHEDRIWIVDFYRHDVLSAREDGTDLRVEATVPQQPSGLGWLPDGRLLVVSMRDRVLLRRESDGELVVHADLSDHVDGHVNDMVVDAQGRAYVGNFGFDLMAGAGLAPTHLLRVDPDGTVTRVADDLWFPNGSVITEENVLLVDETFGNRVTAFDIARDGVLSNRRTWASFGPLPSSTALAEALPQLVVAPDGCCLDAEGALWIADGSHGRVIRLRERRRDHCRDRSRDRHVRVHARRLGRPDPVHLRSARLRRARPDRCARGAVARRPRGRPARRPAVTLSVR